MVFMRTLLQAAAEQKPGRLLPEILLSLSGLPIVSQRQEVRSVLGKTNENLLSWVGQPWRRIYLLPRGRNFC